MKLSLNSLKNKTLFLVGGIVIVGMMVWFGWQSFAKSSEPALEIPTAQVTKGNVSVSLEVEGKTVIERRDLTFEIGGVIRGVTVKEGDIVKPWQTLAYLDVQEAQKNLEKTLRDYSSERNDFDESSQVTYPEGALTDTIKRILEKNQWDLDKAVLDVELKDIAKKKSYLVSPIVGTVEAVNIAPGETASTQNSATAITIVDRDSYQFVSYVEDVEALKIHPDMVVHIRFDALPDEVVDGQVIFVSSVATVDENDLSTYKVVIEMEDEGVTLLDGLVGEAEIVSKEVLNTLKIPNTTVKREDNQSVVYVQKGEETERRIVTLGFTNGKEVEVKDGLQGNEILLDFKAN